MQRIPVILTLLLTVGAGAVLSPAAGGPPRPTLSVEDASVTIATDGNGNYPNSPVVRLTVTRDAPAGRPATLSVRTQDGPGAQSVTGGPAWAYSGEDYESTALTLSLQPGERSREFSIPLLNNGGDADETFSVLLASPDADLRRADADVTITRVNPHPCNCFISGIQFFGSPPCKECQPSRGSARVPCEGGNAASRSRAAEPPNVSH